MTTDPAALLDQLDRLHAACSTGGAWERERIFVKRQPDGWHQEILDDAGTVALLSSDSKRADLIVAAVNALPALTSAVRAVLALADEWDGWQENARRFGTAHPREADVARARELAYRRATDNLRTTVATALSADPTNQEGTP